MHTASDQSAPSSAQGSSADEAWKAQSRALMSPLQAGYWGAAGVLPAATHDGVLWEALLPFLRHALLFSHCCVCTAAPERLAAAAAASSELSALLIALSLPHPQPHPRLHPSGAHGLAGGHAEGRAEGHAKGRTRSRTHGHTPEVPRPSRGLR